MNKILVTFVLSFILLPGFSQDTTKKVGLFHNVKPGLTITYFHNFHGDYVYPLNQDASLREEVDNKNGGSVSLVILFPLDTSGKMNLILNLPIVDLKGDLSGIKENTALFNSQSPFGIGLGFFPFKHTSAFGFTVMGNYATQNRMRDLNNKYFPIASYPGFDLKVGAPVPEAILKPYLKKVNTITVNAGLVFRL